MSRLNQGLLLGLRLGHISGPNLMSISQVAVQVMFQVGFYGRGWYFDVGVIIMSG